MPIQNKWELLREKLADIEHQRWSDWMEFVIDSSIISGDDNIGIRTIGVETKRFDRWKEQMETDYDDLTEKEKDSDREQVDRYFPLLKEFLSSQLEEIKKEIEELKFDEEIQNDGGIKYNEAKNSSNALIQFGYNQALQEIKEVINKMIER